MINAGLPKLVRRLSPPTCRVTEPPYYSTFACNGFSSLPQGRTDMGIRDAAMRPKAPLSGRKGGSFHHSGRSSEGVRMLPVGAKRMSVMKVESVVH